MVLESKTYTDEVGELFFDVSCQDGTRRIEKRLALDEYISLFVRNFKNDEKYVCFDRASIPRSVVWAKVSSEKPNSFEAVMVFEGKKRPFLYMGRGMVIPYPPFAAKVKVVNGIFQGMRLFALKTAQEWCGDLQSLGRTPLAHFPYGNVGGSGDCCFGNISVSGITGLSDAQKPVEQFIAGETNDHLWDPVKCSGRYKCQAELIESIAKCDSFPSEVLKEVGLLENLLNK